MEKSIVNVNGTAIAIFKSDGLILTDAQSALDLAATVYYNDNCHRIALYKEAIIEDFFRLSSGVAGEILQKLVNFSMKLAIIGDFSGYTSKPLKDFIFECNRGSHIFFVADEQAAIDKLAAAV